ncbi:hypothetical protein PSEUDO8BK_30990 [Pseudomonas sp. 8BK]|nr:hypothetical protein PSEUDO8BK_30990 [Pseudomonas sp. 8BK]
MPVVSLSLTVDLLILINKPAGTALLDD